MVKTKSERRTYQRERIRKRRRKLILSAPLPRAMIKFFKSFLPQKSPDSMVFRRFKNEEQ